MFPASAPPRPKHSVVLASLSHGGYAAFDFVPAAAEDPMVALQLLLGALQRREPQRAEGVPTTEAQPKSHDLSCVFISCFFSCVFPTLYYSLVLLVTIIRIMLMHVNGILMLKLRMLMFMI